MSPDDIRAIRLRRAPQLTQKAFAEALGYKDTATLRKYESGAREAPPLFCLLMEMIDRYGFPRSWIDKGNADE